MSRRRKCRRTTEVRYVGVPLARQAITIEVLHPGTGTPHVFVITSGDTLTMEVNSHVIDGGDVKVVVMPLTIRASIT